LCAALFCGSCTCYSADAITCFFRVVCAWQSTLGGGGPSSSPTSVAALTLLLSAGATGAVPDVGPAPQWSEAAGWELRLPFHADPTDAVVLGTTVTDRDGVSGGETVVATGQRVVSHIADRAAGTPAEAVEVPLCLAAPAAHALPRGRPSVVPAGTLHVTLRVVVDVTGCHAAACAVQAAFRGRQARRQCMQVGGPACLAWTAGARGACVGGAPWDPGGDVCG
jgi:hypothetical protein